MLALGECSGMLSISWAEGERGRVGQGVFTKKAACLRHTFLDQGLSKLGTHNCFS